MSTAAMKCLMKQTLHSFGFTKWIHCSIQEEEERGMTRLYETNIL